MFESLYGIHRPDCRPYTKLPLQENQHGLTESGKMQGQEIQSSALSARRSQNIKLVQPLNLQLKETNLAALKCKCHSKAKATLKKIGPIITSLSGCS